MAEPGIIDGAARLVAETTAPNERCSNCRYAHPIVEDLTIIECHGIPPTPCVMGMTPNGPAVGILRPRLPRAEPSCSLWKFKSAVII